ncbi:hypothetical protein HKD37_07G020122 [Glycine soja]
MEPHRNKSLLLLLRRHMLPQPRQHCLPRHQLVPSGWVPPRVGLFTHRVDSASNSHPIAA